MTVIVSQLDGSGTPATRPGPAGAGVFAAQAR